MQRLDLDLPEPTLATWSRTARPIRIGGRHENEVCETSVRHPHIASWVARVDDILFGFSAAALLLVPIVVLPLAALLR